uniref:F-box domain-containing protein n=1 Tax=Ciona savignyi TaxID=51511 RepID=H2ZE34_CIOSA
MADQVFNILRWFYERFFPSHVVKWFYQRPTKPVNYGAYYDPIELHRSYLRDAEEQEIVFPAVTNINHLPYHTLLKIFSYLSMDDRLLDACLVCKYWHEICCDPSFWRVINLPRRRLITNEVLLRVVGYGREIHSIDISELHNKGLTSEAVLSVSKACPKLRKLVISNSIPRAEEKLVIQIIKNCPHLKHLGIDMLNLTDETMFAISTRLKNLEVLSVNKNYSITDDGVIAVIRRCKKIHTLGLDEIEITDRTLNELAAREVRNPTMIDLNVQFGKFTPKGIEVLGKLRNLKSLEITRCKGLMYENLPP